MVLNGDSARLPLPDGSVDAIVTDPPYFDFVHYSELSDFFFAWLAPALGHRHGWMRKPNCFDTGEVQHRDPHESPHFPFQRQITPKTSRYTRCSSSIFPNVSIMGEPGRRTNWEDGDTASNLVEKENVCAASLCSPSASDHSRCARLLHLATTIPRWPAR